MFEGLINYSVGSIVASAFSLTFIVAAIVVGVILYGTVFSKANDGKYTGFMGKLYDFMTFKKLSIESLLKLGYIILAIYVTLDAFVCFRSGFLSGTTDFIFQLVVHNIVLRILFELAMLIVRGCKHLAELNAKTEGNAGDVNKEFDEELFVGKPVASAPAPAAQPVPAPVPQPVPAPIPQPVPAPAAQPAPAPVPQPVPAPAAQPAPAPIPQPVPAPVPQPVPSPIPQPVPQPAPAPADADSVVSCTKCGQKIKAASKFCPFCGNPR